MHIITLLTSLRYVNYQKNYNKYLSDEQKGPHGRHNAEPVRDRRRARAAGVAVALPGHIHRRHGVEDGKQERHPKAKREHLMSPHEAVCCGARHAYPANLAPSSLAPPVPLYVSCR